jgi:hypothetical protein
MKYRLVDIDSLVFKSAVRGLETVEVQKGLYIEAFNLESGMKELTDILSPLETLNTKLVVFGKSLNVERYNFRNIINPQYKADRKEVRTPVGLGLLYDKFYRCNKVIQCEAYEETDDCIVRHYNKAKDSNFSVEIVSVDKDFIAVGDLVHPLTLEVREHDPLFWYQQCILGDGADNIKGIKGMGQVACNKLFEGIKTKEEAEAVLLETYAKKKLDVMDLYKDYFCLALDHKSSKSCLYNTAFGVTSKVDLLNQTWEILTDERVQCKQYQNINR